MSCQSAPDDSTPGPGAHELSVHPWPRGPMSCQSAPV
ncbi:unnamed protein product, partial [Staurois parvus]